MAYHHTHREQDKEATVYVGNLDERVTDALVWELMLQAGRILNVHLPKDRVTQTHQGYGFIEFISEEDADYAARIMNQIRLYNKPIRVNKASADKQKTIEVGAELFVGNLDPMVDERTLYDTFGRFGTLVTAPKIARDDHNLSKGYGFISFADFDASDTAIEAMNGQYLMNKEVTVQYAYKKDGKGERHGDRAERELAAQAKRNNVQPVIQPLPPQISGGAPSGPAAMVNGHGSMPPNGPGGGYGGPLNGQSAGMPPGAMPRPPSIPHSQPLAPPPAGLPARPPPSNPGYGGGPPGFGGPPMPQGFGAPPGAPPGGFPPPGFGPPPGAPPPNGYPPSFPPPHGGYQQPQYGRR
ncbi:MAG: hypothetical protein Q9159_006569 [Coniocarpon cinnabarinum]